MLSLSKCCSLLLLYISGVFAYPEISLSSQTKEEPVPFSLNYTQEDQNFGNELTNTFTLISKDKITKNDVQILERLYLKSKSFSIIKPTIERLKNITDIKDQDDFYNSCTTSTKNINEFTESIEDRFNIAIDTLCRGIFLKRLTNLSANINLSSRDYTYFKESIPFFLKGENVTNLANFLRHFKTNISEHDKISNLLAEQIFIQRIKPSKEIITNIKISNKLHQFLQSNINLDESSSSYFQDEFQKTMRDCQDAIEKGDFNQAKQLANGLVRFFNQNKAYISERKAFVGLIIIAKAFYYKNKDKESRDLFEQARLVASKEDFSEANFYLIWSYVVEKDIKGLKKAIERYELEKNFDKFDSKLQYWITFAESKLGDPKKATEYYNKIISSSPYSFYSIISLKDLALSSKNKTSEEEILSKLVSKNPIPEVSSDKFSTQLKDALKRFALWSKLGNERFQTLEIRYIQSLTKEDTYNDFNLIKSLTNQSHKEFITLNLVKLLNSKKRYISSFRIFQDSVEQNSLTLNLKLVKQIFPLTYFEIIKKNALNLDPLIVISLIRQESAFNPEANSGVGAKGLMQLMPATAKRFNNKVKIKHLANPEINVALGTKYLRQLISRFDGNLIYALASYNAGENRIDRWRREIFKTEDPLATIESIPYEETRNYVKLIYRNYFFYNLIQNKSILKTPIEDSFKIGQYSKTF